MEMARFCRRHPKLMAPLFDKMLEMVNEFETKLLEEEQKRDQREQQRNQDKPPPAPSSVRGPTRGVLKRRSTITLWPSVSCCRQRLLEVFHVTPLGYW